MQNHAPNRQIAKTMEQKRTALTTNSCFFGSIRHYYYYLSFDSCWITLWESHSAHKKTFSNFIDPFRRLDVFLPHLKLHTTMPMTAASTIKHTKMCLPTFDANIRLNPCLIACRSFSAAKQHHRAKLLELAGHCNQKRKIYGEIGSALSKSYIAPSHPSPSWSTSPYRSMSKMHRESN